MIITDSSNNLFYLTNTVTLSPIDLYWTDCCYCAPFRVGTCDISQIPLINHNVYFAISLPLFPLSF